MRIRFLAGMAVGFAVIASPAGAADDEILTRLALCKDSWFDWKDDPAKMGPLGDHFRSEFAPKGDDPFPKPTKDVSILGLKVVQAFPESVGMGVGFSLLVAAPFDEVRKIAEKQFGRPLQHCEASDGMHTCELEIADKRDFTVMAEDGTTDRTLIGCYYFYEK